MTDAMDTSEDVSSTDRNKINSSKKEPIIDDEGFQLIVTDCYIYTGEL
ncbi:2846_t:CDS:2 [Racocetra persica]|uniref:2846_t:CDS:1 n=1 Tax=Racocetra persica TaxID=160502 RepID=A0ACA9PJG3_9GLOM|nr:2846_t:CDS:2 [Racocetra persica]